MVNVAHKQLTLLERNLTPPQGAGGGSDAPEADGGDTTGAQEYNYLAFDRYSRQLDGWCNNQPDASDRRLLPDSQTDHIFAEAVSDMHMLFTQPEGGPVCQVLLRKNSHSTVFGERLFGQETYYQSRSAPYVQPPPPPRGAAAADPTVQLPFDADLVGTLDEAASCLRSDHNVPVW